MMDQSRAWLLCKILACYALVLGLGFGAAQWILLPEGPQRDWSTGAVVSPRLYDASVWLSGLSLLVSALAVGLGVVVLALGNKQPTLARVTNQLTASVAALTVLAWLVMAVVHLTVEVQHLEWLTIVTMALAPAMVLVVCWRLRQFLPAAQSDSRSLKV